MTEKKNIYININIFEIYLFIYFFILFIYLFIYFFIIIFRYAIAYLRTGSYAPGHITRFYGESITRLQNFMFSNWHPAHTNKSDVELQPKG